MLGGVVMVNVFVPAPFSVTGLKLAPAPTGRPLTTNVTVPVPLVALRTLVYTALPPGKMNWDEGEVERTNVATLALKLRLLVQTLSVTDSVIKEEPVWPGTGVIVSVRFVPLPPRTRFEFGITV